MFICVTIVANEAVQLEKALLVIERNCKAAFLQWIIAALRLIVQTMHTSKIQLAKANLSKSLVIPNVTTLTLMSKQDSVWGVSWENTDFVRQARCWYEWLQACLRPLK